MCVWWFQFHIAVNSQKKIRKDQNQLLSGLYRVQVTFSHRCQIKVSSHWGWIDCKDRRYWPKNGLVIYRYLFSSTEFTSLTHGPKTDSTDGFMNNQKACQLLCQKNLLEEIWHPHIGHLSLWVWPLSTNCEYCGLGVVEALLNTRVQNQVCMNHGLLECLSRALEHYVITFYLHRQFFQDRHSERIICLNILFNRTQLDNRKHPSFMILIT